MAPGVFEGAFCFFALTTAFSNAMHVEAQRCGRPLCVEQARSNVEAFLWKIERRRIEERM